MISEAIASKTVSQETLTNDKGGFQFCALPVDHLLMFEIAELTALPGSELKARIPPTAPYLRKDFIAP